MGGAQEPPFVAGPLTKLAGGRFDLLQGDWLGRSTPSAMQPPPSPRAQGKDRKNPLGQDLSHTALCSPHLAVGPVSHRAEEHGEVKVKASPSTASRSPGLPAARLFCKLVWGQGTRSEVTAGSGRARQEDGDGDPLLEFLPGVRLGVRVGCLPGPAGPSRYNQGAEHRVRDRFKFQSAPKGLGFHVTLISSFVNTDYGDDLLPLEEWEIMSFQTPQGLAHSGVEPVFAE